MPEPPKFNPVHRKPRVGPLKLPRGGRTGPIPQWPIPGGATADVLQLWETLWRTPHAVAWEKLEWTRVIARYCLVVRAAEIGFDKTAGAEARQLEDKLGLTPKAMRMLLWEIADDELAEVRQASTDTRGRIKAVG